MKQKQIVAEMHLDWVKPYIGELIPVVIKSDHPRFIRGTRLDYGFVKTALRDGYDVTLKGSGHEH